MCASGHPPTGASPEPVTDGAFAPSTPERAEAARWLLERTAALCEDDTTTGHEDRGLPRLRHLLEELGATVETHEVEPGRHNVLALWGEPRLLFSTHLDTVPPYFAPRLEGDRLHGRGSCDAKGQITAQLGAVRRLVARGVDGLAWLGVVGEETDSVGAKAAAALAPRLRDCVAVIDGEPTENRLATGQRGSLQLELATRGVPAHSGMPELGRSAIWPLLDWLQELRGLPSAEDPDLGPEVWNLGVLTGGNAPNVIPAEAAARIFVRSVRGSRFEDEVRERAPEDGVVRRIGVTPPEVFDRVPGFPHAVVPFGSDAPHLRRVVGGGRAVLCGPGSIRVAHTDYEHVTGADLAAGENLIVAVAEALLGGGAR